MDTERLAQWARCRVPLSGKVKLSLSSAAAFDTVKLNATIASDRLTVAGVRWEPVTARLRLDRQSSILNIEELLAGIFSGMMRAHGRVDLRERGTDSALSMEFAHTDTRQTVLALGWKANLQGVADARLNCLFVQAIRKT